MDSKQKFLHFAIVGMPRHQQSFNAHLEIYRFFKQRNLKVYVDQQLQDFLPEVITADFASEQEIVEFADVIIVVGGDGNMLRAALRFSGHDIPLIGVNKGNLGFLTDIDPEHISEYLEKLLDPANYYLEYRNTIRAEFIETECLENKKSHSVTIFNEIAIQGSRDQRIVEVEVFVDKKFAFGMRGDGLIISTPTGSTAYNLSAGGPIVHSSLHALIITPMNAHTLSSRPIVIPATSEINIVFKQDAVPETVDIYCDGLLTHPSFTKNEIIIHPSTAQIPMVHFNEYNYYSVLAKKLNWSRRLF
ncbi:NAD(+)/NADH kinase [Psittacicella hinzii]|uniref:NAD kinase n=1 Tax=Psittacicella hinzii TaxID=2028575 RepID=A0A3A1YEK3_9GAMM|nr:NAD(+)/NADH kinase [Psittacicella hinzii]RIY35588.1 hypothetical protein CKF58_06600 [Psittacicella hinzii]